MNVEFAGVASATLAGPLHIDFRRAPCCGRAAAMPDERMARAWRERLYIAGRVAAAAGFRFA